MDLLWSSLANGAVIEDKKPFDPTSDRIFFDDPGISAADVSIAFNFSSDDAPRWSFSYGGKTVQLILAYDSFPSSVVAFASDGSQS